jgi:protein-tyrosine phosphatase
MNKFLIVCTANICRSPMALTVARELVVQRGLSRAVQIDSAGTHAPVPAQFPDPRAIAALVKRGYKPEKKRSTRIATGHFAEYDLIVAMDADNLAELHKMCPAEHARKLKLFLSYAPETGRAEVPDPYYGSADGFEVVLDLCEAAAVGLIGNYMR